MDSKCYQLSSLKSAAFHDAFFMLVLTTGGIAGL